MPSEYKFGNRLLDALPAETRRALQPRLHVRPYRLRDTVCEPGSYLAHAIFPIDALISVIAVMADGAGIEIGMVGREGMFHVGFVLGDEAPSQRAIVQAEGTALAIEAAELRRLLKKDAALERLLLRYAQTMLNTAAQSAACNRLHSLRQRCARWLLMAHDRARGAEIRFTHDFLSLMLGARRAGVTVAAQSLQADKLIDYRRGIIAIRDRKGLEAAACECYAFIAADYERLITPPRAGARVAPLWFVTVPTRAKGYDFVTRGVRRKTWIEPTRRASGNGTKGLSLLLSPGRPHQDGQGALRLLHRRRSPRAGTQAPGRTVAIFRHRNLGAGT